MRRIFTTVLLLTVFSAGQAGLLACGDKFFLVGRGEGFSRAYASLHPGNIVIYATGGSPTSKALADGRLQTHFTRAGHHVTVVRDAAALAAALESGPVDVVVADVAEALALIPRVDAVASKPTLLPVQGEQGKDAVQHQFAATLKATDKIKGFLAKIEGVMKKRSATSSRARA
jgi:hypothetical protein